jgi:hypothetical protein
MLSQLDFPIEVVLQGLLAPGAVDDDVLDAGPHELVHDEAMDGTLMTGSISSGRFG